MTERTVTVTASGEATATPTRGRIELQAAGDGDSAAEARRHARDHEAAVRDALVTAGVDGDAVRTTGFSLDDPSDRFDACESDGYRATVSLFVDTTLDGVEGALVAATDAGATVTTVGFGVAPETRESLEREAVTAAMETARGKAEAAVAATGGELGGVRSVDVERDDGLDSLVEEAIGWHDGTEYRPDPVEVAAAVEVSYELDGE